MTNTDTSIQTWRYDVGSGVAAVGLSADGEMVVAGTLGKTVLSLNSQGQPRWQVKVGNQAWRIGLSNDGQTTVVGTGSTRPWDMGGRGLFCLGADGTLRWQVDLKASVWGLALSADGQTIAAGTSGKQLLCFDSQGHRLWQQDVPGLGWYAWVFGAALSADGQTVAAVATDKRVQLLERSGLLVAEFHTRGELYIVAISANGQVVATGDTKGYVYLLNRQGQLLWEERLADKVWAVALSTDGQRLLVGAGEKEKFLYAYDQSGRLLWRRFVEGGINDLTLSANSQRVVVGTRSGGIHIFGEDGEVLHKAQADKLIRQVAISATGEQIVAGSEDGYVYGFQLPSPPPVILTAVSQLEPQIAGTVYNIHIEQATSLAIGDKAQVRAGLAQDIREILDVIKQYEDIRRLASDPKTKLRVEREIIELREILARYEAKDRELRSEVDKIVTRESDPEQWAREQVNLALSYRTQAENIELAINHYQQALEVFTREYHPKQWASIQLDLAAAYRELTYGDRITNKWRAYNHYEQALEIYGEDVDELYSNVLESLNETKQELIHEFSILWKSNQLEDIDVHIRQFIDFFSKLIDSPLQSYDFPSDKGLYLSIFNLDSLFQKIPLPTADKFPILFVATESLNIDLFEYIRQTLSKHLGPNNQQALLIPFVEDEALLEAKSLIAGAIKQAHAYDLICLSREEIEQMVAGEEPHNILRKIILSQMDLTRIPVYRPKGTTPDAMFFGRERELLEISTNIALANYILIGGRRIGKTSILKRLERVRLPANGIRALYHECSYTPTQTELVQELITNKAWFSKPPSHKVSSLTEVVQALPDDKPLVILFDEADKLIKPDQQAGYPIFNTLRALSNANRCSFVLCGERALRSELTNPNSPLYNFGKDMLIGRLERYAVEELVTQPLRQLEIDFADETTIVGRVWEFTSGHPSVIQSLCLQLITRLNQRSSRYLTLEDVEAVVADPNFLRKNFLNVYWEQATILERLCSLVMAADDNIHTLTEMQQALSSRGIEVTLNQIDDALERLVDLRNILQRTASGYEFGVTAFPQVIAKTHRLDDLIALNCETYQQYGDIVPHPKGSM